jgi:hypothetical protein
MRTLIGTQVLFETETEKYESWKPTARSDQQVNDAQDRKQEEFGTSLSTYTYPSYGYLCCKLALDCDVAK